MPQAHASGITHKQRLFNNVDFPALQLGLLIITLVLIQSSPTLTAQLEFSRQAIGHGEYWRLLSGHLGHTNWLHLLLNSLALFGVFLLHAPHYQHLWLRLLFLGMTIGSCLYWFNPELAYYLGLSGILHGLLAWGCIEDIYKRCYSGLGILFVCGLKVLMEQCYGANPATARLIEANIAIDAHLYGFLAGMVGAVFQLTSAKWRKAITRT